MDIVILSGRLTKTPELKRAGDTTVCNFCLAVDKGKGKDGERRTIFFPCAAFGKVAENFVRWFQKGDWVELEGTHSENKWTDRETGQKCARLNIVMSRVHFCGGTGRRNGEAAPAVTDDAPNNDTGIETGNAKRFTIESDGTVVPLPDDVPF